MKNIFMALSVFTVSVSFCVCTAVLAAPAIVKDTGLPSKTEDFKGASSPLDGTVGLLQGMGIFDSSVGYTALVNGAWKIVPRGFIGNDINDQVFIEMAAGPLFISQGTIFVYSAHLRWDFQKDDIWTLYAVGGLGGNITGSNLGNRWELFPRFGAGVFCRLAPQLSLRGEISHEFILAGVSLGF